MKGLVPFDVIGVTGTSKTRITRAIKSVNTRKAGRMDVHRPAAEPIFGRRVLPTRGRDLTAAVNAA